MKPITAEETTTVTAQVCHWLCQCLDFQACETLSIIEVVHPNRFRHHFNNMTALVEPVAHRSILFYGSWNLFHLNASIALRRLLRLPERRSTKCGAKFSRCQIPFKSYDDPFRQVSVVSSGPNGPAFTPQPSDWENASFPTPTPTSLPTEKLPPTPASASMFALRFPEFFPLLLLRWHTIESWRAPRRVLLNILFE